MLALGIVGCGGEDTDFGPAAMTSWTSSAPEADNDEGDDDDDDDDSTSGPDTATSDSPPDASTTADSNPSTTAGSASTAPGTSSTTLPPDDSSTSTTDPSETAAAESSSSESGTSSSACDELVSETLVPPVVCDGPNGNTTTEIPPNDLYATSWFGCYFNEDGTIHEDPFDNCEFACGNQGLCPAGQDGPTCEANLMWFAANADRYGCGGRIRVTNCENDKSVILVTLDRGPNCNSVEKSCDAPVMDMSHDAMVYLFDGGIYGGCDHQAVIVEQVADDTPLGPE